MAGKQLDFGGEEHFAAPPDEVYPLLTDLEAMQRTIPDLSSAERVDDRTLKCIVRPGFSFLRGTMNLTITIDKTRPPEEATMQVDAKGIGVAMKIVSRLHIAPEGDGSRLKWDATVSEMKGLVSTVSPALVRGAADGIIRHSWQQVHQQLAER